jgi:hypothetical protein
MPVDGRFVPAPGLQLRSWGESCDVVFDPTSGMTHRIAAAPAELIRWLMERGTAADARSAATEFGDLAEPLTVAGWLHDLLALGLLWRVEA